MRSQTRLMQYLLDWGLKSKVLYISNKCPDDLRTYFKAKRVDCQLCPPHDHRTNQSEKAIDTWKCHFLAGLIGVDPDFPIHLWCSLLSQATQTLSVLRRSWINPRLPEEAELNGAFDYNWTPMAPQGTKVLIHETPQ